MTSHNGDFYNPAENKRFTLFGRLIIVTALLVTLAFVLGQEGAYVSLPGKIAGGANSNDNGGDDGFGSSGDDGFGSAADGGFDGADAEGSRVTAPYPNIDGEAALANLLENLYEAGIYPGGDASVMSLFIGGAKPFSVFGAYGSNGGNTDNGGGVNGGGGGFYGKSGGVSGDADLYGTGGFPAIPSFFARLCEFSVEIATEHQLLLDKRSDSVSYARQLAAAKHLSYSAYRIASFDRELFIQEHGMSAAKLGEKDIAEKYDGDYFLERLETLGFFRNDTYGKDINRRNAIIRAQSSFNMPITGKIDLETKRALIEGTDYEPRDIVEGERPEGMWVVIDKSKRILTVYIDDAVFAKYPVAVGKSITLTPEGQFKFVSKAKNPRWGGGGYAEPVAGGAPNNPLGKRWMGLSKGGGGQYGVHGNVSAYSIGTNASHGCVRMINSDVEEMYEYITVGTPVWIGTTDKLAEWGIYQQLGSWEPDLPSYLDYLPHNDLNGE